MVEERLEFADDKLFVYTPLPQHGEGICKVQLVMTKEIFQECYKKWIEPQQKIGHWVDGEKTKWKCSGCGYGVLEWNNTPYCPNCGRKMEREE